MENKDVVIYCDMDGVLADFLKYANQKSGGEFTDDHWNVLPVNTYELLDPMPDAKKLWSYISKYDVRILTAYPSAKRGKISKSASKDKVKWMHKYFKFPKNKIHTVLRSQKQDYANENHILIDDHMKNIKEFQSRGGIGIHHKSAAETIRKLKGIGL